jgi:hypothetical protein
LLPVIAAALALALALVLALVVFVVLMVELAPSVPPSPLQIKLPTFACVEVVATVPELVAVAVAVIELATAVMVVFVSVIVELPTTRKSLFDARLTGVSRIVTDEAPAVSVVPAMTIGWVGKTTTGRL